METLKLGDTGHPVQWLQHCLTTLGYNVPQNGCFGPEHEKAVQYLQACFFMPVTGQVDRHLWGILQQMTNMQEVN